MASFTGMRVCALAIVLLTVTLEELGVNAAKDCSELWSQGNTVDGVFDITPDGVGSSIKVYCEFEAGGGWTRIQRREDGSVEFNNDWTVYKNGFGNKLGEHWLGNDNINALTQQKAYNLKIDLVHWNGTAFYAQYSNFTLSNEADNYRIQFKGYEGTAGDSLTYHNTKPFSTKDRDNDEAPDSCVDSWLGAWWFVYCSQANLNGKYWLNGFCTAMYGYQCIGWLKLTNTWEAPIKEATMKIQDAFPVTTVTPPSTTAKPTTPSPTTTTAAITTPAATTTTAAITTPAATTTTAAITTPAATTAAVTSAVATPSDTPITTITTTNLTTVIATTTAGNSTVAGTTTLAPSTTASNNLTTINTGATTTAGVATTVAGTTTLSPNTTASNNLTTINTGATTTAGVATTINTGATTTAGVATTINTGATTSGTTTGPATSGDPIFDVIFDGVFTTKNNTSFPGNCAKDITTEVNKKADQILTRIYDMMGTTLCKTTPGSLVLREATNTNIQNHEGRVTFTFTIYGEKQFTVQQRETCGVEVSNHVRPHSNWDLPLLGNVTGCSNVNWDQEYFNMVYTGWKCASASYASSVHVPRLQVPVPGNKINNKDVAVPGNKINNKDVAVPEKKINNKDATVLPTMMNKADTTPLPQDISEPAYEMRLEGTFTSSDNQSFSDGCAGVYSTQMTEKAAFIIARINDVVGSTLCTATSQVVVSQDSTDVSLQNAQGNVAFTFTNVGPKENAVQALESCAQEVLAHLQPHSNWDRPLIEAFETCPTVNWNSAQFTTVYTGWGCLYI